MTLTSDRPTGPSARDQALEAETHARAARKLHSHAGVASILNTKPGKMTLLQMHAAVQRKQADDQRREQLVQSMAGRTSSGPAAATSKSNEEEKAATINAATADNAAAASAVSPTHAASRNLPHPLDYSVTPDTDVSFVGEGLQMQELVFSRGLALYAAHERSLEINPTKHRIGAELMSEDQRASIEAEREAAKDAVQAAKREAQRTQSKNILSSARVISMVGERSTRAPTFIVDEAEPWPARARLLAKLKGSINKFVLRRRVDERLANVAAHAANKLKNKLARMATEDGEEVPQARAHPLLAEDNERDEDWVLRDFPLATNNVQSVGHLRGHDHVTRTPVALESIAKPKELLTFDEIIPFDAALMGYPTVSAPVVPTFVGSDWLAGMRTGAWEESLLRAPRGESEVDDAAAAAAAAGPKPVAAALGGAAVAAPLTIHAQLSSSAAAPLLTSPAHTSVSLLDVDSQNSRSIKPVPPATPAAAAAGAAAPTVTVAATGASSRSAHTKTSDLRLPVHFLSSHPIAQQHAVASAASLSVPVDVPANMELSPNFAFRAANMRETPDTGFFYTRESAGCASLRTLQAMTTLSDLWRPRREPALAGVGALVDSFALPLGSSSSAGLRQLRRQPREDRIDPRDREVAGDETSAKLRYKPVAPTMELACKMYDQAAAAAAAAAAQSAAPSGSHAASSHSAAAAATSAPPRLDIGLGLSLLSTAIQFPPALAAAAARAQAQAAINSAAASSAAAAAGSAAVAASPRSSRGRRGEDSAAAGDDGSISARSRREGGASSPSERSRSKKTAAAAAAGGSSAPAVQPPPRLRGTHGSALPPAGSGVPLGEGGLDLLVAPASAVAAQWQYSAAAIAHASSAPGASSVSALLPVSRAPAQALSLSSLQSSATAAAATSSPPSTGGMHPSSLSWGAGAQAASAALQQRLGWAQVQSTNALALAAHTMQPMTQHTQQHLTMLTQK